MSCSYPAGIIREDDGSGYSVYFPDLPNVAAGGESVEEALNNASSGLAVALRDLAERNAPVPAPSSMEEARAKVRAEREADELPFPDDSLFQNVDAQAFS
ncbi:MAG TPA: type II toxin-antitoxin system HicB family antitoxin [Candidatus Desulfovibrio intestinigallinarum]|nr:type II toxin-antitoxin system HicB family antitoxin [Candidatus Desulfovibrio intestinigallinarum]